jgi:hypothetical protein
LLIFFCCCCCCCCCQVVRHKHQQRDGVTSLVLGCSAKRPKQLHPRQLGEFVAAGVTPKRTLWECKVTDLATQPLRHCRCMTAGCF